MKITQLLLLAIFFSCSIPLSLASENDTSVQMDVYVYQKKMEYFINGKEPWGFRRQGLERKDYLMLLNWLKHERNRLKKSNLDGDLFAIFSEVEYLLFVRTGATIKSEIVGADSLDLKNLEKELDEVEPSQLLSFLSEKVKKLKVDKTIKN